MFIVRVYSVRHSFHLRPRATRTDESGVTLRRTDTSSDEEEKTVQNLENLFSCGSEICTTGCQTR